jgi:hypothetical protein
LKRRSIIVLVCNAVVIMAASAVFADSHDRLPDILTEGPTDQAHFLPDFSYAGYGNAASDVPAARGTVVQVDEFGAVADDGKDDSGADCDVGRA